MRALLLSLSISIVTCSSACAGTSSPRIDVMKTGGMYPARPAGCTLEAADINDPAYDRIGMIAMTGGTIDDAAVASLRAKACELGGDALYMNMSSDQMRAYTVLRKKPAAKS